MRQFSRAPLVEASDDSSSAYELYVEERVCFDPRVTCGSVARSQPGESSSDSRDAKEV